MSGCTGFGFFRSAGLSPTATDVSVPRGCRVWSVRPHDLRVWVNSGRSLAQRCHLGFALSWCEGSLRRAWM